MSYLSEAMAVSSQLYELVCACNRWMAVLAGEPTASERYCAAAGLETALPILCGDDYPVPVTQGYGKFLDRVTDAIARVKGGAA